MFILVLFILIIAFLPVLFLYRNNWVYSVRQNYRNSHLDYAYFCISYYYVYNKKLHDIDELNDFNVLIDYDKMLYRFWCWNVDKMVRKNKRAIYLAVKNFSLTTKKI